MSNNSIRGFNLNNPPESIAECRDAQAFIASYCDGMKRQIAEEKNNGATAERMAILYRCHNKGKRARAELPRIISEKTRAERKKLADDENRVLISLMRDYIGEGKFAEFCAAAAIAKAKGETA